MSLPTATILKIGGNVLNHESTLARVLDQFSKVAGPKVLVHGGGRAATELAERLDLPQTLIEGRRVTDEATLRIAVMVYGGLINKSIVAGLQARGCQALGVTGADLDLIRARKRSATPVDYGWVGDVTSIRTEALRQLLDSGHVPVIAPLTHDGTGNLLNTNADTIAREVACALATAHPVRLIFSFEKAGVLRNLNSPESLIPILNREDFVQLKASGVISEGMVPKLENAFLAIDQGVHQVIIGQADRLPELLEGTTGTRCLP